MPDRCRFLSPSHRLQTQRGAAFLILVFMIGIAGAAIIVSAGATTNFKLAEAQRTSKALATARDALIGFAAGVSDSARLGDLPCPATDFSTGIASSCSTSTLRVGYLPWSTLGLPPLRDGSGSPLIYAVSNNFKNDPRVSTSTAILNSDLSGEFTVSGENAIAIVFAPGTALRTQDRTATTFSVTNFLELENADGDTTFDNAAESSTFNDRLIWITPRTFFPPLEMRALRVAQQRLQHYFTATGRYPQADRYVWQTPCQTAGGGRVPYYGSSCLGGTGWTMVWPSWFWLNYWDYVIHYAVAQPCTTTSGGPCDGSGSFLTLDNIDNYRVLLIRQGIPNGQTRPCTAPSQCLDDGENRDSDRDYITPVAGNDRLTVIAP